MNNIPQSIFFLLWLFFFACKKDKDASLQADTPATLVYMIADNNLSFFASKDINEMEEAMSDEHIGSLYVYVDKGTNATPAHPYILKIKPDKSDAIMSEIIRTYSEVNSSDPIHFNNVIKEIQHIAKQDEYEIKNLILWSHGNAWLPPHTSIYNDSTIKSGMLKPFDQTKSFGLDEDFKNIQNEDREMDIQKLSKSLDGFHFNCIAFDACFMGSIEVLYALRDRCDYIVCSPAELNSTGFPYYQLGHIFHTANKEYAIQIAKEVADFYTKQKDEFLSYTITVIETQYLQNFSAHLQVLAHQYLKANMQDSNTSYTYKKIQQYDRLYSNYFFDCKDFYTHFLTYQQDPITIQKFNELWNKMVVYENHSPQIMGTLPLKNVYGISMYILNKKHSLKLQAYYKNLEWYEATYNNNFWGID